MCKCVVCLSDDLSSDDGVFCSSGHFLCSEDLSSYLAENVLTQVFKLRRYRGKVECPCVDCDSTFNALLMFNKLESREQSRYISILGQVTHEQSNVFRLRDAILDILTLKCPKCKIAIDPLPDACSAVMCLNCGSHYCNYCFVRFDSGDSQQDRAACHEHVTIHKNTDVPEERDAFLSEACVKAGQNEHQLSQLRRCLLLAMTSRAYGLDGRHDVCLALILCFSDLASIGIDAVAAWNAAEQSLLDSVGQANSSGGSGGGGGRREDLMHTRATETTVGHQLDLLGRHGGHNTDGNNYNDNNEVDNDDSGTVTTEFNSSNNDYDNDDDGSDNDETARITNRRRQGGRQLANAINTLNSTAVTQIILSFNADLDLDFIDPSTGFPVASLAILAGQDEASHHLIAAGCDLYRRDRNGRCVLYVAVESGNRALLEHILACRPGLDLDRPVTSEPPQYNALHVAIRYNHGHLLRLLVRHGASLEVEERECNHGPLALALILGSEWAATELVLCGADYWSIPPGGRSPLYIAVEKGYSAILSLIQQQRHGQGGGGVGGGGRGVFDVNMDVSSGGLRKMIHIACAYVQPSISAQLIGMGADLDALNHQGSPPLITALLHNSVVAAVMLIKAGARVDIPSQGRLLPMYLAVERGHQEVVFQLIQRGVSVNASTTTTDGDFTPLHLAILHKQHHLIPMLLSQPGIDLSIAEYQRGLTPLLLAVVLQDELSVRLLAPFKPDPLVFNHEDRNCLFIAAEHGSSGIIQLLLSVWGASVNAAAENIYRQTALHIACVFDQAHTVRYLLQVGADVNAADSEGHTPLDRARESSAFAAEAALLEFISDLVNSVDIE